MDKKKLISILDTKRLLLYFSILIIIACIILELFMAFKFQLLGNDSFFAMRAVSLKNGEVPYTINSSNHPPFAVYFLYLLSIFTPLNTISVHLAGFFWDILILILIFFISKKYFGVKKAIIASAIYIVVSFSLAGVGYSSEHPSAFFGLLGVFFYFLFLEKGKKYNLFLSGLMIGISIWFKQPGFFFFFAVLFHQLYFFFKKKQSFKSSFINTSIVAFGSLVLSIPLLIYFFYYTGWKFLYDIIIFNLLFKTTHSRILIIGKCLRMLLEYFGFLFVIILAAPKKEESEDDKKIISFCLIAIITMIIFYFFNRELFPGHFINLLVIIVPLSLFYIRKFEGDSLKIIRILLIIFLLTIFMIKLEAVAREYQKGEKAEQEQITEYLLSTIPSGSSVYSVNDVYTFLTGYNITYRYTNLMPNIASMDNFDDFCEYIDGMDYLIFTGVQKKYLGQNSRDCVYSKFSVIKTFDMSLSWHGDVEILKKNSVSGNIPNH